MKLGELQKLFEAGARGSSREFEACIEPAGTLTTEEALSVYRQGHTARLTEALGELYEGCWRLLGDEAFFEVSLAYIDKHPSVSHNLSHYGESFPEFLRAHFPDEPLLADLARFEWLFAELFHAKEERGLEAKDTSSLSESSRVQFVSSLFLCRAAGPAYTVWKHREDEDPPEIDFSARENLLAYRSCTDIHIRELSDAQADIVQALMNGMILSDALAKLSDMPANVESEIQDLFALLAGARLIRQIHS